MTSEMDQPTLQQNEPLPPARILGIETSCDETAVSVVENGKFVLSSKVASQAELHARFGGVFPEVASRQHIRTIYKILDEALHEAHLTLHDVDAVAVTRGPGLPGSLVVGLNMAKGLVLSTGLPLIGVNHLEGHIYSAWIQSNQTEANSEPKFPLLILIVSGGHTELVLMEDHLRYRRLGGTLDDAAGEAFDKVARLLGLSYPGGPSIQRAAEIGNSAAFNFPRAMMDGGWDFSFSGLKTAVLRQVRALQKHRQSLPVADLAASFQAAVVDVLVSKTTAAAGELNAREILIAGGVSANRMLRETIRTRSECRVHIPPIWLCTDNAAMIAAAGYYRYAAGQRDGLEIDVLPNWPISEL